MVEGVERSNGCFLNTESGYQSQPDFLQAAIAAISSFDTRITPFNVYQAIFSRSQMEFLACAIPKTRIQQPWALPIVTSSQSISLMATPSSICIAILYAL
jgi:hypothetical protein